MEIVSKNYSQIKGWGVDADLENDPAYPMRNLTKHKSNDYNWPRSVQQSTNIEVLHSNERPNLSAVFGTSVPPSGLSGMIRRFAFKYSEGSFGHWIPLIIADRVNVIEGILDDFKKGKIPNLFLEKGGRARWKYDKMSVIRNALIGVCLVAGSTFLLLRKRRSLQEMP